MASFIVYHKDTGKILRTGVVGNPTDLPLQSQADYEIVAQVPDGININSLTDKVVADKLVKKTQVEIAADTKPPYPKYAHILDSEWKDILARVSALEKV